MVTSLTPSHMPPTMIAGAGHGWRAALASLIRSGARALEWLAEHVAPPTATPAELAALARVEYHCDAGAPEGALYVDGILFGHLQGVDRL